MVDDKVCKGCGTRRGGNHCKYPSNLEYDSKVEPRDKRNMLSQDEVCVLRRKKANAISAQNKLRSV